MSYVYNQVIETGEQIIHTRNHHWMNIGIWSNNMTYGIVQAGVYLERYYHFEKDIVHMNESRHDLELKSIYELRFA